MAPKSPPIRRALIVLAVLTALVLVGARLRSSLGIELDVDSVRSFAEGLGALGPLLFVGIVAGRAILALPSQVVLIAAGLCFGTLVGTLVGGTGLMLSGLAIFVGTRYAGQDQVEKHLGPRMGQILAISGRRFGAAALAIGSAYPIAPLSPIQAAAGLTPMPTGVFVVAALLGSLVRAAIFAYFGNSIAEASLTSILLGTLPFVVIVGIPLLTKGGRAWLRRVSGLDEATAE